MDCHYYGKVYLLLGGQIQKNELKFLYHVWEVLSFQRVVFFGKQDTLSKKKEKKTVVEEVEKKSKNKSGTDLVLTLKREYQLTRSVLRGSMEESQLVE